MFLNTTYMVREIVNTSEKIVVNIYYNFPTYMLYLLLYAITITSQENNKPPTVQTQLALVCT